ncbi:hypothetical protein CEXT_474641 [Caerostris extrusa]|uniref:LAGLIDADG homing endonuclease n=1 Tax=Caerostris extrusa TaxID=172846 RepID=A0AAV4VY92_CAEEX|nr:hypothetical protein CEXT_474641 [Caerostris extrusa]
MGWLSLLPQRMLSGNLAKKKKRKAPPRFPLVAFFGNRQCISLLNHIGGCPIPDCQTHPVKKEDQQGFNTPCKETYGQKQKISTLEPELSTHNSFTPLDEAVAMITDEGPLNTQPRMSPVMVNIENQDIKLLINLIGTEFPNRINLKISSKFIKRIAINNQAYQDILNFLLTKGT